MSTRKWLIVGALLATAVVASGAMAQDKDQPTPMMGPGMMIGHGPMMEGQLTYLKAELGITDAQMEAWNAYVEAVKARAATMQGMHASMMQAMQSGTALQRMEAHTQAMQSMVDSMKAIRPATEALYEVLTDEQKKKADLLLGNGCCMM